MFGDLSIKWTTPIGHFQVLLCFCFKTNVSAKPFLWKWLWFAWKWNCRRNSFVITAELISLNAISMLSFNRTLFQRSTCPVSLGRCVCVRVAWIFHSLWKETFSKVQDKEQIDFELFRSLVSCTVFSKRRIFGHYR